MYDKHNPDPFAIDPREFNARMKAHASLVLGYRPSSRQLTTALIKHVMKDRKADSESMLALARELFPTSTQEEADAETCPCPV